MKKSAGGDQTLNLNRVDFERAGTGRKAGYKFTINFVQGKVSNIISGIPLAADLALALQSDPAARDILANAELDISLNTKFQLSVVNKKAVKTATESSPSKVSDETEEAGQ
jgi:hypothetical protein